MKKVKRLRNNYIVTPLKGSGYENEPVIISYAHEWVLKPYPTKKGCSPRWVRFCMCCEVECERTEEVGRCFRTLRFLCSGYTGEPFNKI